MTADDVQIEFAHLTTLSRPNHALLFLYSVIAALALQARLGLLRSHQPAPVPVFLSMVGYGGVDQADQLLDFERYPHLELMRLLSANGVYLIKSGPLEEHAIDLPQLSFCGARKSIRLDAAVVGSMPFLFPTKTGLCTRFKAEKKDKRFAERNLLYEHCLQLERRERSMISKNDFALMRSVAIRLFNLTELPVEERHLLFVVRQTRGRAILNQSTVVDWLGKTKIAVGSLAAKKWPVRVVEWEGRTLRQQLQLAVNSIGMVGAHGNGLAWACFMEQLSGTKAQPFLIEFASRYQKKNEVSEGIQNEHQGNIAGRCGLRSLSLACSYAENLVSRTGKPNGFWKNVDLVVGPIEFNKIRAFLEHGKLLKQSSPFEVFRF